MLILDVLDRYIRDHPYGVSPGHERQLRVSIQAWQRFAGRPLTVQDLTPDEINRYLDWMRSHRAPDTTRTRRGNLLILWHFAYENELTETAPRRIRKLRPIQRFPLAWTLDELRKLIAEAAGLPGCFWHTRIRRGPWWESLIRTAYDTSLRLGDLLRLAPGDVSDSMVLEQHKTRRMVHVSVRPATLAVIDQTMADEPRDVIWRLWGTDETFFQHFRKLVLDAGIRRGTFRWLRRTAATQVEMMWPGRSTELLGHASRSTTEQWYIDRSQLSDVVLPPL